MKSAVVTEDKAGFLMLKRAIKKLVANLPKEKPPTLVISRETWNLLKQIAKQP